jgi:predicted RNA-binding protein
MGNNTRTRTEKLILSFTDDKHLIKGGINKMDNNKNLVIALNGIVGLRKLERSNKILACSRILNNYLIRNNHEYFKRDFLINLFNDEVKPKTRNIIIKDVLNILVDDEKIYQDNLTRSSKPFLRYRELYCMDDGSYTAMMNRNGFEKVDFFKWSYDKIKKIPKRIKVDTRPLGEDCLKDFDFSVLRQTKPRSRQNVYSNTMKSLTLTRSQNDIKVFRLGKKPNDKNFKIA